jgi:hypothetical protein
VKAAAWLVLAGASFVARPALAQDADGSYGRIEGDLLFVGEAGAAITTQGPQLETHVGLLYMSTAGPYFRYVESFGDDNAAFDRVLAAGLELRPLFLGRYALDLAQGPPHLDLFVDSLALIIGAQWEAPLGRGFESLPGLELGASIEVPLLPSASGPYLGLLGLARFGNAELVGTGNRDFLERGASLVFTLAWHQVFDAGLVDIRDRRREP